MSARLFNNYLTFQSNSQDIVRQFVGTTMGSFNTLQYGQNIYTSKTGISTAQSTSINVDSSGSIYLAGIYNSANVPVPIYGLNNNSTASFSLPGTSTNDNFLIIYDNTGLPTGYTVIPNTNSFGPSVTFYNSGFYFCGNFKSSTSVGVLSISSGTTVSPFSIQIPTSPSVFNSFVIKYSSGGTALSYVSFNNSTLLCSYFTSSSLYIGGYYPSNFPLINFTTGTKVSLATITTATVENGYVLKYILGTGVTPDSFDSVSVLVSNLTFRPQSIVSSSDTNIFVGGYYGGTSQIWSFSGSTTNGIVSYNQLPATTTLSNTFVAQYNNEQVSSATYLDQTSSSQCTGLTYSNGLFVQGTYNASSTVYNFVTATSLSLAAPTGTNNPYMLAYGPDLSLSSIVYVPTTSSTIGSFIVSGPSNIFISGQYTSAIPVPLYNTFSTSVGAAVMNLPASTNGSRYVVGYGPTGLVQNYNSAIGTNGTISLSTGTSFGSFLYNSFVYNSNTTIFDFTTNGTSGLARITLGPTSFAGSMALKWSAVTGLLENPNTVILDNIITTTGPNNVATKKYADGLIESIVVNGSILNPSQNITSLLNPPDLVRGTINPLIYNAVPSSSVTDSNGNTYIASLQGSSFINMYDKDGSPTTTVNTGSIVVYTIVSKYDITGRLVLETQVLNAYPSSLIVDLDNNVYLSGYSDYGLGSVTNLGAISVYDFSSSGLLEPLRATIPYGSVYFVIKWSASGTYDTSVYNYTNPGLGTYLAPANSISVDSNGQLYETLVSNITSINNFTSAGLYNLPNSNSSYGSQILIGSGNTGTSLQGSAVAIYKNTMAVGAWLDNGQAGATWVFTRNSAGTWSQQGSKLVGSGGGAGSQQGSAVGIYEDILIEGGNNDGANIGAIWIYQRTGTIWNQIGSKVVPTGNTGSPLFGRNISLYKTVVAVGGPTDNTNAGAVWIVAKTTSGTWAQQGSKLVPTGNTGAPSVGSVSLTSNRLAMGGPADNTSQGATWIFTSTNGTTFTQEAKLIGTGNTGAAQQGFFVSMSDDGNFVLIGAPADNSSAGCSYIFYRNTAGSWTQQGPKLVGTGATGAAHQGSCVSMARDASYAAVLGYNDNTAVGAVWIFTRTGQGSGSTWSQYGSKIIVAAAGAFATFQPISCYKDNIVIGASYSNSSVGSTSVYNINTSSIVKYSPNGTVIGQAPLISMVPNSTAVDANNNIYMSSYVPTLTNLYNFNGTYSGYNLFQTTAGTSIIKWSSGGQYQSNTFINNVVGPRIVSDRYNNIYCTGTYISPISIPIYDNILTTSITTGTWSQQGSKLVGSGATSAGSQGQSMAISGDGNYIAVGAFNDNSGQGAAWIFTRSGTIWTQQAKLIGTGNTGAAQQGQSISINSDGTYVAIGGIADNTNQGAVWIFNRIGINWTQQGAKLVGSGVTVAAQQGQSVSINSDGSYVAIGGQLDNTNQGAAWVFNRVGTVWSQQGGKLVGTGNTGAANQGQSIAINSDGTYMAVGGINDNTNQGAAWIYNRSGTTWTQQGSKLVGTGVTTNANQGRSVSFNSDASYLAIGGITDNSGQGAVWIFTRSVTTWTQQTKLVGTGVTGAGAGQGRFVSLNTDASVLLEGGITDNTTVGAAWVFTRASTVWTQQANLVGTGGTGTQNQGKYVGISSNGSYIAFSGQADNTNVGATWVFTNLVPVYSQQLALTLPSTSNLSTFVTKWNSDGLATGVSTIANSNGLSNISTNTFGSVYLTNNYSASATTLLPSINNTGITSSSLTLPGITGSNSWSVTGSLNLARQNATINLINDGTVLIAGGQTANTAATATSSSELYSTVTKSWSSITSSGLSLARFNARSTVLTDGRILVAGGINTSGTVVTNCDIYDPNQGLWTSASSMGTARSTFGLVTLNNSFVLAAGGGTGAASSVAELYNPSLNSWVTTGSLNVARFQTNMVKGPTGDALIMAGFGITSCEIYNVTSGAWSVTDSIPGAIGPYNYEIAQISNALGSLGGQTLFFGGAQGSSAGSFSYNYATQLWSSFATPVTSATVSLGSATALPSGLVLLAGGTTDGTSATGYASAAAFTYNTITSNWTTIPNMSIQRLGQSSILLKDGTFLVVGGSTSTAVSLALSSAEIYTELDSSMVIAKYNSGGQVVTYNTFNNVLNYSTIYTPSTTVDTLNNIYLSMCIGSSTSFGNLTTTNSTLLTIDSINNQFGPGPQSMTLTKWTPLLLLDQGPFTSPFTVTLPDSSAVSNTKTIILNKPNYTYNVSTNSSSINLTNKSNVLEWSSSTWSN